MLSARHSIVTGGCFWDDTSSVWYATTSQLIANSYCRCRGPNRNFSNLTRPPTPISATVSLTISIAAGQRHTTHVSYRTSLSQTQGSHRDKHKPRAMTLKPPIIVLSCRFADNVFALSQVSTPVLTSPMLKSSCFRSAPSPLPDHSPVTSLILLVMMCITVMTGVTTILLSAAGSQEPPRS